MLASMTTAWTAAKVTLVAAPVLAGSLWAAAPALAGSSTSTGSSASGSTTSQAASTGSDGVHWRAACDRVSKRIERLSKTDARIGGDASTKGSIAHLQARIAQQRKLGNTDAVRLLTDRLTVRQDVAGDLPAILAQLRDAQQVCSVHQDGSSSSGSSSPTASSPASS